MHSVPQPNSPMWAPVSKDATGEGEATDAASKVAGMNFGDVDPIGIGSTSPKFKRYLALQHPDSIQAYMDGKDAFVKQRKALALAWSRTRWNRTRGSSTVQRTHGTRKKM